MAEEQQLVSFPLLLAEDRPAPPPAISASVDGECNDVEAGQGPVLITRSGRVVKKVIDEQFLKELMVSDDEANEPDAKRRSHAHAENKGSFLYTEHTS